MLVFFVGRVYGLIVTESLSGSEIELRWGWREHSSQVKLFPIRHEEEPCYSV